MLWACQLMRNLITILYWPHYISPFHRRSHALCNRNETGHTGCEQVWTAFQTGANYLKNSKLWTPFFPFTVVSGSIFWGEKLNFYSDRWNFLFTVKFYRYNIYNFEMENIELKREILYKTISSILQLDQVYSTLFIHSAGDITVVYMLFQNLPEQANCC